MRVLVCGSREMADWRAVSDALWSIHHDTRITEIIHGTAHGADELAKRWANMNGIPERGFRPEWKAFGKAAGPIRNKRMIVEGKPDLVIAFPGKNGTKNMVDQAEAAGLRVWRP